MTLCGAPLLIIGSLSVCFPVSATDRGFLGGHPHRQSTLSGYRSGGFVLAWPMMVSAGRCPCRLVRRGSEHDHDPAWASGLVACSLFESQSDPRSAQTNLQRGVCVWSGLFCRVDDWCNDMSVVNDWRDRLCGRLVGGRDWGCKQFAGGDEVAVGCVRERVRRSFHTQ